MDQLFEFKNKSANLIQLRNQLTKSIVLDQMSITFSQWKKNRSKVISQIEKFAPKKKLIVRSSHTQEDNSKESLAGYFQSIGNIDRESKAIEESIDSVFTSYQKKDLPNKEEQFIFIQPFIEDLEVIGVALSCDIETYAPYVTINTANTSPSNLLTSGKNKISKISYVHRSLGDPIDESLEERLIYSFFKELEVLTCCEAIEVEFGIDFQKNIYLFQVRPLFVDQKNEHPSAQETKTAIKSIQTKIQSLETTNAFGTTVLSDMADWNPAEMIGNNPKPLARSLYFSIIGSGGWAFSRDELGYSKVTRRPEQLFTLLGNHPYVNIITSFSSFIPKDINKILRGKLLQSYLERLKASPNSHDKVEFDILYSCNSPLLKERLNKDKYLNVAEKEEIFNSVSELTLNMVNNSNRFFKETADAFDEIESLINQSDMKEIEKIERLYDFSKTKGAYSFSLVARLGFVTNVFLKELKEKEPKLIEDINSFVESIETVTTRFKKSYQDLSAGRINKESFLESFGHLRPGTYHIETPSYAEAPERYLCTELDKNDRTQGTKKTENINILKVTPQLKAILQEEVINLKIDGDVDVLIKFLRKSIQAREEAKFYLSKTVSYLLSYIRNWLKENQIGLNATSYVEIENILSNLNQANAKELLKRESEKQRKVYELNSHIKLPPLITSSEQLFFFNINEAKPTFITNDHVSAKIIFVDQNTTKEKAFLKDKIVVISFADPGYDWIFNHSIVGLITEYGGMGSHMAIRCAEIGLPAAIGCGEVLFKRVLSQEQINLNCKEAMIC